MEDSVGCFVTEYSQKSRVVSKNETWWTLVSTQCLFFRVQSSTWKAIHLHTVPRLVAKKLGPAGGWVAMPRIFWGVKSCPPNHPTSKFDAFQNRNTSANNGVYAVKIYMEPRQDQIWHPHLHGTNNQNQLGPPRLSNQATIHMVPESGKILHWFPSVCIAGRDPETNVPDCLKQQNHSNVNHEISICSPETLEEECRSFKPILLP